jgi:hypothetical protein
MIEWRIYRGDKPSPLLSIMQVLIEDWKRDNPSASGLDGLELMEVMGIVEKGDKSVRLERVEVPWMDKEGRVLEELTTLIKKPSRNERRRVEKEYLKGLKKANNNG